MSDANRPKVRVTAADPRSGLHAEGRQKPDRRPGLEADVSSGMKHDSGNGEASAPPRIHV